MAHDTNTTKLKGRVANVFEAAQNSNSSVVLCRQSAAAVTVQLKSSVINIIHKCVMLCVIYVNLAIYYVACHSDFGFPGEFYLCVCDAESVYWG